MNFPAACTHRLPFGPYKGQAIAEIGSSTPGLLWLVFHRRECESREMPANRDLEAVSRYLDEPHTAARVLCLPKAALS